MGSLNIWSFVFILVAHAYGFCGVSSQPRSDHEDDGSYTTDVHFEFRSVQVLIVLVPKSRISSTTSRYIHCGPAVSRNIVLTALNNDFKRFWSILFIFVYILNGTNTPVLDVIMD